MLESTKRKIADAVRARARLNKIAREARQAREAITSVDQKIASFFAVAEQLDRQHDPDGISKFVKLSAELAHLGRLRLVHHSARALNVERMLNVAEYRCFGRPAADWKTLAKNWVTP
jgi:hypothetical protein